MPTVVDFTPVFSCCYHLMAAVALLPVVLAPVSAADASRLSITGLVDRPQIKQGESVNIAVIVGNSEKAITDCKIRIIAGAASFQSESLSLSPSEEQLVTCTLILENQGHVEILALVSWKEGGIARATSQLISEMTVLPADWFGWRERLAYAAPALLVALTLLGSLLGWWFSHSLRFASWRFRLVLVTMTLASLAVATQGLLAGNSTLVVSGLVLLSICGLMSILGERQTKRLLARVQKAGPVEFSIVVERAEYVDVAKASEREFKKPKVRVESAKPEPALLEKYLSFYRLRALSLECRLIGQNPSPPANGTSREKWLESLPAVEVRRALGKELPNLQQLYRTIGGYADMKQFFESKISALLERASDPNDREIKIFEAIGKIEDFMWHARYVPPHCFNVMADLQMVLGHREAAMGTMYSAQSIFPDSVATNYALAFWLMDLANDPYTALVYGDKALAAISKMEDDLKFSYRDAVRRIHVAGPDNQLAPYLRAELELYKHGLRRELGDWLKNVHHTLENFAAYAIARAELVHREEHAKRYAKAAVEAAETRADYLDTLGLVKLNFGIINRDRDEIAEACKLLIRAGKYSRQSGGTRHERRLIRLHQKTASAALRSAAEWD
jgi:hypothetical protein